jgi:ribosomal protein L11 methyltransferase
VLYPALDVSGADGDLVLAVVDDYSPSAVDGHGDHITIFFADSHSRDGAREAVVSSFPAATVVPRDVDDEDWARRSQQNLQPIAVGRVTVRPPWAPPPSPASASPLDLVIVPSMGFGTGHHATTRLCLEALQQADLAGKTCLDVGTGSGVLALAARLLGAASALGIDMDPDAVQSAEENLTLNPTITDVRFELTDLRSYRAGTAYGFDVVTANLTGALILHSRDILIDATRAGGHLILSGVLQDERIRVQEAFSGLRLAWTGSEQEWTGFRFEK